ncbi:MAG: YecA family protein [Pseudomonadales bacterium]|uniref:YecA family protein n=1 Tax=Oleiphilus messinensis TaxID=141451 RepID=A0A1Y0I3J4_9GAMM|nr:YecA family protein [Oleiphilus messinensis]ARU55078.1 yecA family protein [Oleiphilus messinensis]MCG8609071.1 YecA family protein [Pseudomonadales bacterium]
MSFAAGSDEYFDFDELTDIYQAHKSFNPPSEIHGIWCGRIAGGAKLQNHDVLRSILEHMGVDHLESSASEHFVLELYRKLESQVQGDDMNLALLLPDDDFTVSERVHSLTLWVSGFLEGVALEKGRILSEQDDDIQELLRDLVEISQIDTEVEDDEASEVQLIEVVEHVRMAVLTLYVDLNPGQPSVQESHTIH